MTKAQLLANADSMELTKWFAYFEVKSEREDERRKSIEFQNRIEAGG
jgi:hypothetical protein